MEEVPKHEQLFVLMDANARTGRREKEQVGSKDSKILGAYGRDTLNDSGELLLSFANNHDLALVNTFFSTPKGGVSHKRRVQESYKEGKSCCPLTMCAPLCIE